MSNRELYLEDWLSPEIKNGIESLDEKEYLIYSLVANVFKHDFDLTKLAFDKKIMSEKETLETLKVLIFSYNQFCGLLIA